MTWRKKVREKIAKGDLPEAVLIADENVDVGDMVSVVTRLDSIEGELSLDEYSSLVEQRNEVVRQLLSL